MMEVVQAGLLVTVQDAGRIGYGSVGIHPSGAMDKEALYLANALVGNDDNTAALEMHMPAGKYRFHVDTWIAITGGQLEPLLDGTAMPMQYPVLVRKNTILHFGKARQGFRAYLAVAGGFDIPLWKGSAATDLAAGVGGWQGRALQRGDRLPICQTHQPLHVRPSLVTPDSDQIQLSDTDIVDCLPGPDISLLEPQQQKTLWSTTLQVQPHSNRMGIRLRSVIPITGDLPSLISSAVLFGTVQLLPNGELICLMADHPTTGGYPRVLQVPYYEWGKLAQLRPGATFRVQRTELAAAVLRNHLLLSNHEARRNSIRLAIQSYLV